MYLSASSKKPLLLLLAFLICFTLPNARAAVPVMEPVTPNAYLLPAPPIVKGKKKGAFNYFKHVKQTVKKVGLFYKALKKRYQGNIVGSTILIAVLLALGVGAVLYLLAHAGISGLLVTILGVLAFAFIIYWAVRRIRWNS
jgi:hypothetical protein